MTRIALLIFLFLPAVDTSLVYSQESLVGTWSCQLECPGGALKFGLTVEPETDTAALRAFLTNGSERISVPSVVQNGTTTELRIDHYDSSVVFEQQGPSITGRWKKKTW